ncbi:MAG: HAD hydrolase-like protein, partial [bacterium]|nr:HAD hydrolase-like protein [bacterium]
VLGLPVTQIFGKLFPQLDKKEALQLNDYCTRSLVYQIRLGGGYLFDGVKAVLNDLNKSGYKMLVASNGRQEYVEAILETYDIIKYFMKKQAYLNDEFKDKTDIVRYYIDNIVKEDIIIMIGDRFTDREAAEKNDIPFSGCTFGHSEDKELQGVKYLADSFKDIPGIIKN